GGIGCGFGRGLLPGADKQAFQFADAFRCAALQMADTARRRCARRVLRYFRWLKTTNKIATKRHKKSPNPVPLCGHRKQTGHSK
ncbi:hypothetical protein, partial [Termitidicoccus mucosus]|uniref:hypothetical protein n=1 Tax=Termitidicoccus mucosus TaxID=1184151 RepID=UPI002FEE5FD4